MTKFESKEAADAAAWDNWTESLKNPQHADFWRRENERWFAELRAQGRSYEEVLSAFLADMAALDAETPGPVDPKSNIRWVGQNGVSVPGITQPKL